MDAAPTASMDCMTGITLAHPLAFTNMEHVGRFPAAVFLSVFFPFLMHATNFRAHAPKPIV